MMRPIHPAGRPSARLCARRLERPRRTRAGLRAHRLPARLAGARPGPAGQWRAEGNFAPPPPRADGGVRRTRGASGPMTTSTASAAAIAPSFRARSPTSAWTLAPALLAPPPVRGRRSARRWPSRSPPARCGCPSAAIICPTCSSPRCLPFSSSWPLSLVSCSPRNNRAQAAMDVVALCRTTRRFSCVGCMSSPPWSGSDRLSPW